MRPAASRGRSARRPSLSRGRAHSRLFLQRGRERLSNGLAKARSQDAARRRAHPSACGAPWVICWGRAGREDQTAPQNPTWRRWDRLPSSSGGGAPFPRP